MFAPMPMPTTMRLMVEHADGTLTVGRRDLSLAAIAYYLDQECLGYAEWLRSVESAQKYAASLRDCPEKAIVLAELAAMGR